MLVMQIVQPIEAMNFEEIWIFGYGMPLISRDKKVIKKAREYIEDIQTMMMEKGIERR